MRSLSLLPLLPLLQPATLAAFLSLPFTACREAPREADPPRPEARTAGSDAAASGHAGYEAAFGTSRGNALEWPVWFGEVPGRPGHFLAVERGNGKSDATIWAFSPRDGGHARSVFLTQPVKTAPVAKDERGLLALAFHPRFAENRRYYVYYVPKEPLEKDGDTVAVDERLADSSLLGDSREAPRRILTVPTPYWNHKGGTLLFGPDGHLYVGLGDGGNGGDPHGNSQNLRSLLGKMLRLDVDHPKGGRPYGIPSDNPFPEGRDPMGRPARPEIWAYGLRNPWRSSFDPATGLLWVGDLGQDRADEIDIVRAGDNLGWNKMEGYSCFRPEAGCDRSGLVLPVADLTREESRSLTGGLVLRGNPDSPYHGAYLFGDYETQTLYLLPSGHRPGDRPLHLGPMPDKPVSFATDADGGLYFVGYGTGRIYRIHLPSPRLARED